MVVRSSILISALLAFGLSGVASAESPSTTDSITSESFSIMTGLSLDMAFEKATSPVTAMVSEPTGGPTHMQCSAGAAVGEFETCVVTADARVAAVPAAMAPR